MKELSGRNARHASLSVCLFLAGLLTFSSLPARGFMPPVVHFSEIDKGSLSAIKQKLDDGANPDRVNGDGQSLLWEAAYVGREELVRLLLSYGADPDLPDVSGKTPLYWAASNGEAGIVRLLLARGADPNRRDGEGPALEWAIANGHRRVVRLLNHWTEIRREYLLRRLPLFLNLISRQDRIRLGQGHLIQGPLPYALPHGLLSGPWKNRRSFVREAMKVDRSRLAVHFGDRRGSYPPWRQNALLEIGENLGRVSAR